jgi:hypothetical protein
MLCFCLDRANLAVLGKTKYVYLRLEAMIQGSNMVAFPSNMERGMNGREHP